MGASFVGPIHVPLLARTRGVAARAGASAAVTGAMPETLHYGSVAIVDAAGHLVAGLGDPAASNFTRSTLKPLQALPFVEDGGLARYGLGSQELALLCASHSGETVHTQLARTILERIDAGPADLQCGVHPPTYYEATGQPRPQPFAATSLHHNCSGKHCGFLAYCRLHGHRLTTYLDPDAPLQLRIRNTLQRFAPGDVLVPGTDGCNAPNYALPLRRLAHIYARLATGEDPALRAIFYAMTRHPDLVAGTARTDLALMQVGAGDWVCKIGAEGTQAIGLRSQGLGIAVRIGNGDSGALHAATVEVLHQIGLLDDPGRSPLAAHFRPAIRNARGLETGRVQALFTLPRLVAGRAY